jgi:hypothetical protein
VRTGDKSFSLSVLGFVYDEKGNYLGSRRIGATISLNDTLDQFKGDGEAAILDPAGSVVAFVPTLTVQGKRFTVETAACHELNPALRLRPEQSR